MMTSSRPSQRFNAFGQPMRGSKIKGVGAFARARGYAYGALTTEQRGQYGSQKNFQAAAEDAMDRQAMEPEEEAKTAPETPEPEETGETKTSLLNPNPQDSVLNTRSEFIGPTKRKPGQMNGKPMMSELAKIRAGQNKRDGITEVWKGGVRWQ